MNVLLSYGFYGTRPLADQLPELFGADPDQWPVLYVDSGAFQAHMGTRKVTVEGYADWLADAEGLWARAFTFDVIGDAEASQKNWEWLDREGLDTVPVFHGGEPWDYLEMMVDSHDLVALGGMASSPGRGGADTFAFIARCFTIAGDTQLHGLGMTSWAMLKAAPWASVDSSSWGQGHRYGSINAWDGRSLVRATPRQKGWPLVLRQVQAAGWHLADLADYKTVAVVNAYAWLQMEQALQVSRPDFKVFLVDGAAFAIRAIHQARQRLEEAT